MQRRLLRGIILVATVIPLLWFSILLRPDIALADPIQTQTSTAMPSASPTASSSNPTTTTNTQTSSGTSSGIDPTFIALLGVIATLVGSLIAAGAVIYQTHYKSRNKQEHPKTNTPPRARKKRFRQKTYREALHADPHIARLQILDMSRPLQVTDIYIRVRLHQETRASFELDPALRDAAVGHDPNELLKASRLQLESRTSAAMEPEEALRRHKRCVIVGDPGAGKTTLLKYLALKSVDQQLPDLPDLPIHVELNRFASSEYSHLLEFAASVWEERYGFPKAEALAFMQSRLQEGKALLLLDALDETVTGKTREESEESYYRVAQAITEVASYTPYREAPMVVTARKAGYHQRTRLTGFTELEVLDFRPEDIKQFVNQWFASHPDPQKRANAADLNARLERNLRIQTLAANPLLLSLIVIVYEDQLDLPDRRAELYKQCVDILLSKWDASRNVRRRREFKPEHKQQLLEEVAWHFHLQGQRYFPENELLTKISDFLPAIGLPPEQRKQVLDEIAAENGLLKEQARGWYGFLHLTLQEYFAAQYAVDQNQLNILLANRGDPWWEEVILLYAGRVPDASPLLQQLLGQSGSRLQEDIFSTNLILAGRCLATRPTARKMDLRDKVISDLFDILRHTRYSLIQEQVANTLAEIGGTWVNAHLLRLLSDAQLDSSVREKIADALGRLGERSIVPQLLALLSDARLDSSFRISIARALGNLGERSVAPQLLALLSDARLDSWVRMSIADVLGNLGERSVAPQLLALLSDGRLDPSVRGSIARALGSLADDETSVRTLASLLQTSDIADNIPRALWSVSRRANMRIFLVDGPSVRR